MVLPLKAIEVIVTHTLNLSVEISAGIPWTSSAFSISNRIFMCVDWTFLKLIFQNLYSDYDIYIIEYHFPFQHRKNIYQL
jgi:hypothetical protein